MKKQNETWAQYLNNKNVRPKTFNITVERKSDGRFEVLGNQALMLDNRGRSASWERVSSRDLARAIRNSGITSK
jgi:hypothetical protein